MNVLVLGGTREARELAETLSGAPDVHVVVSLAGHTSAPVEMPGATRTGGFGGVDGLVRYLGETAVDVVVDATHPFSATMPANARAAAARAGVGYLRLLRPPWTRQPDDVWVDAEDDDDAARLLVAQEARRVFLTTGRLNVAAFARLHHVHFVLRSIEPPTSNALRDATVLLDRGPFDLDAELQLLREHRIDTLVTKNAGGPDAKLVAARLSDVKVVMVRRPPVVDCTHVSRVDDAVAWLQAR